MGCFCFPSREKKQPLSKHKTKNQASQAFQGTQKVSGGGSQARISQLGGQQSNAGGRQYSNGQLKDEGVNYKNQVRPLQNDYQPHRSDAVKLDHAKVVPKSEPIKVESAVKRMGSLDSPPSFKGFLLANEGGSPQNKSDRKLSTTKQRPADPRYPNTRLDKENALPSSVRVIHMSEEVPASVFEPSLESEKAEITEIMNRKKARDGKLMSRSDSDASSNSSYANRLPSLKYNESANRYRNPSVSSNGSNSYRNSLGPDGQYPRMGYHSRVQSEAQSPHPSPSRNSSLASRAGLTVRDSDSGARPAGLHTTKSGNLSGAPGETGQAGADLYEFVGHLGSGKTGVMKLMKDRRTKELVAAKWVQHTQGEALSVQLEREIVNHRRLLHTNIIRFREVFATDDFLVIVMDYASIGPLSQRIATEGPLEEDMTRLLFRQLVDGMVYCHRQGVVHRDLMLGNLLLDGHAARPILKISGFAYSKAPDLDSAPKSAVTAPLFLAPEVLLGTQRGQVYDGRASDVWACGIILFNIVTGKLPFQGDTDVGGMQAAFRATQKILSCEYDIPKNVPLSAELKDLIARIFVADPKRRIDSYDLTKHPWLSGAILPVSKAETVVISKQTESDISDVMERARKRREARLAARRAKSSRPENFNEDLLND